MNVISSSNCVSCYFTKFPENKSEYDSTKIEVFFGETGSFNSWFSYFKNYISIEEQHKANKFYSDNERNTYISCHALLRLILANRLKINPLDLSFIKGINDKPFLLSNQMFFNISHTRESFAIALARDFHVGIDLEKIKQSINFHPIIENYFSNKEREYILDLKAQSIDRFFQLWTRKEALLKALGTGIINNLRQVNVSEPLNFIKRESFDKLVNDSVLNEFFIYSFKLRAYFLSVAIPHKSSITFNNLNEENIPVYLD